MMRSGCRAPLPVLFAILLLAGCASAPPRVREAPAAVTTTGLSLASTALAQLGRPYKYGGNGPQAFDCSGLVYFIHGQLGIQVPRTTEDQFRAARPVARDRLAPGDLLFFRIDGRKPSHVGIYAGEGRFVHAPQTGRPVEVQPLGDSWYSRRLLKAGRLY